MIAKGPIVAASGAAPMSSKSLAALGPVGPALARADHRPDRGADFAAACRSSTSAATHVIIPDGVHVYVFAHGPSLPGITRGVDGPTIGFIRRFDEPRRDCPCCWRPCARWSHHTRAPAAGRRPGRRRRRSASSSVRTSARSSRAPPRRALPRRGQRSSSRRVYCARSLLGGSDVVAVTQALTADYQIVASDLDAFCTPPRGRARRQHAGCASGGRKALGEALLKLLNDPVPGFAGASPPESQDRGPLRLEHAGAAGPHRLPGRKSPASQGWRGHSGGGQRRRAARRPSCRGPAAS